jgi:hypothetical protein
MPSTETETAEQDSIESYPSGSQPKESLGVVDHGLDCDCGVTVSLCILPITGSDVACFGARSRTSRVFATVGVDVGIISGAIMV